jgi:hypothetical protein
MCDIGPGLVSEFPSCIHHSPQPHSCLTWPRFLPVPLSQKLDRSGFRTSFRFSVGRLPCGIQISCRAPSGTRSIGGKKKICTIPFSNRPRLTRPEIWTGPAAYRGKSKESKTSKPKATWKDGIQGRSPFRPPANFPLTPTNACPLVDLGTFRCGVPCTMHVPPQSGKFCTFGVVEV